MSAYRKALTNSTINKHIISAQYAVRGKIPARAGEMSRDLAAGSTSYPFSDVTYLNIGNPQFFRQPSVNFFRDVLAATLSPNLLKANSSLSADVKRRAQYYLDSFVSMGSYTDSCGNPVVAKNIADFIAERDGVPCDHTNIITSNGASSAISIIMSIIASHNNVGFMIPLPQYPLYSAQCELLGGHFVGYYLDESKGWQCGYEELVNSYNDAVKKGVDVKCITIINPGNPTGQVLSYETIEEIIKFAYEKNLVILADEVYQENIYTANKKFHSFKEVLMKMQNQDIANNVELVSFHSCSKGFLGECGLRGGYMELCNLDPFVKEMIIKWQSISLCSNTVGQVMTDLKLNPPSKKMGESDETIEEYLNEKNELFNSLKRRSERCYDALNQMDNIHTQEIEGAMYAFPTVNLSRKFIQEAEEKNVKPDFLYCEKVLENTGMAMVPGSGFGQREGTHHFRTTILPLPEKRFSDVFENLKQYNNHLHKQYA